jgi:hypothetical protein
MIRRSGRFWDEKRTRVPFFEGDRGTEGGEKDGFRIFAGRIEGSDYQSSMKL